MNTHGLTAWVVMITLTLLLGCNNQNAGDTGDRLARVGSEILTYREAAEQLPDFMLEQDSLATLRNYREDWIRRQVILQEAERIGIEQNRDLQKRLQRLREEMLMQGLKDYVLAQYEKDLEITDEEARNYYQEHKDQLVLNERYVRYRHLVATNHENAQSARRDLMRGIEWPEVARKYSLNADAKIQESEKFWPISMALAENNPMNTMLKRIGITEISPIRRVGRNYHFVQLMDTRPEGEHPDLDWLIGQIKEWMRLEKRKRHFNSYVKNLYLNAQSNNEIETFNVLESSPEPDTLLSSETNE